MAGYRRVAAASIVLGFGAATAWLLDAATRPERLPVGSTMPALEYRGVRGPERLATGSPERTVVVWFHTACPHCVSELDAFERELSTFDGARLYLLSSEDSLFSAGSLRSRWPGLAAAGNVTWGIVPAPRFQNVFGTMTTPALFVFGPQGTLVDKYVGEVAPRVLVAPEDSSPVRDGIGPAPPGVGEPRDRTSCAHPDASRCAYDPNGRDDHA